MARTKISEFSATAANNTDIDSINLAEGCAPSGINDAIRELMSQLKDWQAGTSNDPMVIGSSGSLTLNQGTANGVAYLNGSKVVTSGSALTFDGSAFGVSSASNNQLSLNAVSSITGTRITISRNSTANTYFGDAQSITGSNLDATALFTTGTNPLIFGIGSEQMRLTSTGLGIGTSSPSEKLHVNSGAGNVPALFESTDPIAVIQFKDNNSTGLVGVGAQTNSLIFYSNNAVNMRLDENGNLGLGVTPSASTTAGTIYFPSNTTFGRYGYTQNAYFNGTSYIYSSSSQASLYQASSGQHIFYTAASGTAGNAITFTQAMTLDASGRLGIGTSSPANRLSVEGSTGTIASFTNGATADFSIICGSNITSLNAGGANILALQTGGTERARILSTGQFNPGADNSYGFGGSGIRWAVIWAANGTIQTSDERQKNTITNSDLGLDFISQLRPVSYKWNIGQNIVSKDDNGNDVITPRAGVRTHYGLIAQEVKAVLGDKDFGGFIHDTETDEMGLRYDQFISPLIKAIQEQQAIIESLKARLDAANL